MFALVVFSMAVASVGCGDDDPQPPNDAGSDGADGSADASRDAAVYDPGPAPACDDEHRIDLYELGFDGQRDEDPDGFVSFGPEGPYVFIYRTEGELDAEVPAAVHLAFVPGGDGDATIVVLDEVRGPDAVVLGPMQARLGDDVLAVWGRGTTDETGNTVAVDVRGALVDGEGTVTDLGILYASSSPVAIAGSGSGAVWLLRAEIERTSDLIVSTPLLSRIDAGGEASDVNVNLLAYVASDVRDVLLASSAVGAMIASATPDRVGHIRPFGLDGTPSGQRNIGGVPGLTDFAASDEAASIVFASGSSVAVGVVTDTDTSAFLIEADGQVQTASVTPAWPGFVVSYLVGRGEDTTLWTAGVGLDGRVLAEPRAFAPAPHAVGQLRSEAHAGSLRLGFRVREPTLLGRLALAQGCIALP